MRKKKLHHNLNGNLHLLVKKEKTKIDSSTGEY